MHYSLTFMASTAALFTLAFTSPIASSSTPHVHVVRNEAATNAHKAITNAVATTNVEKLAAVNAIRPDKVCLRTHVRLCGSNSMQRSYASINAEDISTERASLNAIRPTHNKVQKLSSLSTEWVSEIISTKFYIVIAFQRGSQRKTRWNYPSFQGTSCYMSSYQTVRGSKSTDQLAYK